MKIPIPLPELMKNEYLKKSISKMLHPEYFSLSIESVNLQD
jgi:hypothetical protein